MVEPNRGRKLSVVVLTYNRLELTAKTLRSLYETIPKGYAEVIVVDNGSTDGTTEYLLSLRDNITHLVANDMNHGSAQGFNLGIRLAKCEHILVTDNDYEFKYGWLEHCLELFEAIPSLGVISPCDNRADKHRPKLDPPDSPLSCLLEPVNVPTCMLTQAQVFRDTDGFENYGYRYGDTDVRFCQKAMSKGWRVAYTNDIWAVHLDKTTRSKWRDENEAEQARWLAQNNPRPELDWKFSL